MRVIVCGSRGWNNRKRIARALAALPPDSVIVHGDARGADRIAAEEAGKLGLEVESHPAMWDQVGRRAGPLRNEEMARLGADHCLAFWDGRSKGTGDMIERAMRHLIPIHIEFP